MKKYIEITADTNDGDYISQKTLISFDEIEKILPIVEAIKNFKPYNGIEYSPNNFIKHNHNFPVGDNCRKDLGEKTTYELYGHLDCYDYFMEIIPYGIHTIIKIAIIEQEVLQRLL